MSYLPILEEIFDYCRPLTLLNQHFGVGLDHGESVIPNISRRARRTLSNSYYRPWSTVAARKDAGSTVELDKDKFQVNLDVQQFAPEEITVKATGENEITVEGKHEEKQDEHGYISRHFIRRYKLPKGHDINKVASKLSSDGILTITAPKENKEAIEHKEIPITLTGKPSKAVTEKGEAKMDVDVDVKEKTKKK